MMYKSKSRRLFWDP